MPIQAVIFDIGGILELTPDLGFGVKWERTLGLRPGELEKKLGNLWSAGSVGTVSEAEVVHGTGEILGISAEQVEALIADIWVQYLGTPNTPLIDYFRGLRQRYKTAIISNSFVGAREREEERYQFSALCEFILYSHEVGIAKPDPRIYALACDRLGVRPEEVVFLDDFEPNVTAAREFGMRAVLFRDNEQAIAEIEGWLEKQ